MLSSLLFLSNFLVTKIFNININYLYFLKLRLKSLKQVFTWQKRVKSLQTINRALIRVSLLVVGFTNKQIISSIYIMINRMNHIRKKNGLSFLAKYLKACHIICVKSVAKDTTGFHSNSFEPKVSLTKAGLPRIIPSYLRVLIRTNHIWSIKLVLTIFNLYRVLPYPGTVKLSTITADSGFSISDDMRLFIKEYLSLLNNPTFTWHYNPFAIKAKGSIVVGKGNSTSGIIPSLLALKMSDVWPSVEWFFSSKDLKRSWISGNVWFYLNSFSNSFVRDKGLPNPLSPMLGRLAYKEEPGKVRVFAMSDIWTQWILKSLHDFIFDILSKLKEDGTFNQDEAVRHLQSMMKDCRFAFSFDLSAATDRLPLEIQKLILNFINTGLGDNWANLLVNRDYLVPPHSTLKSGVRSVRYKVGQPMGALSSWAMLALSHHFVVQYAAFRVFKVNKWFTKYVVLGDDIVILDPKVAKVYYDIMTKELCVDINLTKSVQAKGHAEFAKRFISADADLSGISLKEFESLSLSWNNILSLILKFRFSEVIFSRVLGRGSISAGNIRNPFRTRRISVKWIESVLYNIVIIPDFIWKIFHPWVVYYSLPVVEGYLKFLKSRLEAWKYTSPVVLNTIQAPWGVPSGLRLMSSQEIAQLRRLVLTSLKSLLPNSFWPDYLKPGKEEQIVYTEAPSEKFPKGKFKTVWVESRQLFDSRSYTMFLTIWDKYLKNIFYAESSLWEEMVWGRRNGFLNKVQSIITDYSIDNIRFNNHDPTSKVKLWGKDPIMLFSHSNPRLDFPNSIDHLFVHTSSEKKYEKSISEDKDVSFSLAAFILIWKCYNKRLDLKLLSAPKPVIRPKVSSRFRMDR